jgi:hypothetical protein
MGCTFKDVESGNVQSSDQICNQIGIGWNSTIDASSVQVNESFEKLDIEGEVMKVDNEVEDNFFHVNGN